MQFTLPLNQAAATRVRFAVSELWETVLSLRLLQSTQPAAHYGEWVRAVRPRFDPQRYRPLLALVPPVGFLADTLTSLVRGDEPFALALEGVAEVPDDLWHQDLETLSTTPARAAELRAMRGAEGRRTAIELLREYHGFAIAPFADRLRAIALADIDVRSRELASGGVARIFEDLNPRVRLAAEGLLVDACSEAWAPPADALANGLVLVPSVFVWPSVATYVVLGYAPTVAYAPMGIGNLWRDARSTPTKALEDLLGPTRARVLLGLDLPMSTTQVATVLRLAPATANAHLKTLTESRLTTSHRDGRAVLYRRTGLGDSLVASA